MDLEITLSVSDSLFFIKIELRPYKYRLQLLCCSFILEFKYKLTVFALARLINIAD